LKKNGVEMPNSISGQVLWHAHLAIAAAKKGRGVTLASSYLVENDLRDGSLVEIFISPRHGSRDRCVCSGDTRR